MALLLPYQSGNEIYVGPNLAVLEPTQSRSLQVHTTEDVWAAPVKSILELGGYHYTNPNALAALVAEERFGDVGTLEQAIRTSVQWVFNDSLQVNALKAHQRNTFDFEEPFLLASSTHSGELHFLGRMHAFYHYSRNGEFNSHKVFLSLPDRIGVTRMRSLGRIVDLLRGDAPGSMQEPLEELRSLLSVERRDFVRILQVLKAPGLARSIDTQGKLLRKQKAA